MGETVNIISGLISSVGFPIAAFCMMWYLNVKMTKSLEDNTEALNKLSVALEEVKTKND